MQFLAFPVRNRSVPCSSAEYISRKEDFLRGGKEERLSQKGEEKDIPAYNTPNSRARAIAWVRLLTPSLL